MSAASDRADLDVPVLVVGGGGCGLTASIILSDLGIEHLLVERHPGTSLLPKAHYLNQRTMEVFRQHGVADDVYAVGTPPEMMAKVRWRTTLGGDEPLDARTFYELTAFGGGELAERYARDSACRASNYPQLRLEPLLRRHAERRAPGCVRFGHELGAFVQDADAVTARITDLGDGREYRVRARYVIAADGGKTVGPALGVTMTGPARLARVASSHVRADLSEWWDEACLITWFINPDRAGTFGSGAMVPMGPTWGRHSEEWAIHFNFAPDDPAAFDEVSVVPYLRALLKLPELELEVLKVSNWVLEAVLAERYREGRIFLAGDAAHRHPPTTGLGLNTAIQDAHNLTWKLAAVLRGHAGPGLLDSFAAERRAIGRRNVDWAMFTAMNHSVVDAGMGLHPGMKPAIRRATIAAYFEDTPMGATRRARAAEVFETQRTEFQAHDLDLGYVYADGAFVPDGTPAPAVDPMGGEYRPTTRPGHRLPHAWLEHGGERLSTHDLARNDGAFVLLTGTADELWEAAAKAAAAVCGVTIRCVAIGHAQAYRDADGTWARVREIPDAGAILVRPDNHVAWRAHDAADAQAALQVALRQVLAR